MTETEIMAIEEELDADEALRDEIEQRNNGLPDIFVNDLAGLPQKALKAHLSNAHTYINLFLMTGPESPYSMEQGVDMLDEYFGYFFIRKCMWATSENLPENAESVRMFYKSMMEHDVINADMYTTVETTIKAKLPGWVEACRLNEAFEKQIVEEWQREMEARYSEV